MQAMLAVLLPVVLGLAFDGGGEASDGDLGAYEDDLEAQAIMLGNDSEVAWPSAGDLYDVDRVLLQKPIRKCCPPGLKMYRLRVPNEDDDVTCKIPDVPDNSSHLWVFSGADGQHGFPLQCHSNIFKLVDIDNISSSPEDFCVDKLVDTDDAGNALSEAIMGRVCVSLERRSESMTITKVVPILKCCPLGQTYDLVTRECTTLDHSTTSVEEHEKVVKTLLSHVFDKNLSSFINLSVGFPSCAKAMMDVAVFHLEYEEALANSDGFATINPAHRRGDAVDHLVLPPGAFCVDHTSNYSGAVVVKACHEQEDYVLERFGCVRKCCPHGQFFGAKNEEMRKHICVPLPHTRPFHPKLYYAPDNSSLDSYAPIDEAALVDKLYEQFIDNQQPQQVVFSAAAEDPCTGLKFLLENGGEDRHYLDEFGELFYPYTESTPYPREEYCVEDVLDSDSERNGVFVFMCLPSNQGKTDETSSNLSLITVGLLISSMFLTATLVTYCCLPALQNLHGKTLMCHVSSLLVAYLFLAFTQIATRPGFGLENDILCKAIGNCVLFTFLSAFSWLNVMCVDIWRTFGAMRSSRTLKRTSASRRFRFYCLYSWGVSSFITALSVIVDLLPEDILPSEYRPQMGVGECWFHTSGGYGLLIYYAAPLLVQTCVNLVLFILTARNYSRIKTEISRLHDSLNPRRFKKLQADSNKLKMNAKLFVVMGVTWVLEVVSTFFPQHQAVFYLSDTANTLQGVMIFCIFVLKRKVMRALAVRMGRPAPPTADSNKSSMAADCRLMTRKTASNSTLFTSDFRCTGVPGRSSPTPSRAPLGRQDV